MRVVKLNLSLVDRENTCDVGMLLRDGTMVLFLPQQQHYFDKATSCCIEGILDPSLSSFFLRKGEKRLSCVFYDAAVVCN